MNFLWRLVPLVVTFVLCFLIPDYSCAQVFFETTLIDDVCDGVSGKFYDLPGDGFSQILGTFGSAGEDGIDVYKIEITDQTDVYIRHDGGGFDSKVFLFQLDETDAEDPFLEAVLQNDDDSSQINSEMFGFRDGNNHLGGTIGDPPSMFTNGEIYYLAVGRVGDEARNSNTENIFATVPDNSTALVGPSDLTTLHRLTSWDLDPFIGYTYSIRLNGAKVVGYSIASSTSNQFNWTGEIDGSMANASNWLERTPPISSSTTDVKFDDISQNNDVQQDLTEVLCVRSVDVNCSDFDFVFSSPDDTPIEVVPYGRLCVREGLPIRCFRIMSPLQLDVDAVMVCDDGEFLIDGSNGNNGIILGEGSNSFGGSGGVIFKGTNGNVTFKEVGDSIGDRMDSYETSIELTVRYQGDNFFVPPQFMDRPNRIRGPVIFDSFGGGSINGGDHQYIGTVVIVTGGDLFTLNTGADGELFRFTSSLVLITSGTELFCQSGTVTGGQAEFVVSPGATLRNGGVDFLPRVFVEENGRLTGTGVFSRAIVCNGILEPGNSAGSIEILDDLELSETTVTCIELGGASPQDFDRIVNPDNKMFENQIKLAGELSVTAIDGFIPQQSDQFIIMNDSQIVDQFESIVSDMVFQVEYGTNFVRLFNFQSGEFTADTFTIASGALASGGIKSAQSSDDQYIRFFPEPNLNGNPRIRVSFDSVLTTDTNIENLSLTVESHTNSTNLTQTIFVFNWTTGLFESVDFRDASFDIDATITLDLSDRIADFVGPNNEVRCRTRVANSGPTLIFPWQYSVDQLIWDIN